MKTIEISPANGANPREYSPAKTQRRREIQVEQASRPPSTQGRDGSPQPSQDSGASRRHPRRLRLKSRASRRSAPTISPLHASEPPHDFSLCVASLAPAHLALRAAFGRLPGQRPLARVPLSAFRHRRSAAFTLLEVLVATAVLALMMTFLFNLLGSSAKIWEIGNKKIEAAQAARVGLNIMASDLKNAFAGNMTSYSSNGTAMNNIAPFMAFGNNTTTTMGLGGGAVSANGSQQIAGVALSNNSSIPYNEFGYMAVFINDANGIEPMIGDRYYLVKKVDGVTTSGGDFYFRGNSTASWHSSSSEFYPIVDNCIRLKLEYYGNETSGTPDWTTPAGSWTPTDRLPLGVLVTISVVDSKTAIKINAIKNGNALSADEITNGLSSSPPATLSDVERLIAQGSVTMSRFIPFNAQ